MYLIDTKGLPNQVALFVLCLNMDQDRHMSLPEVECFDRFQLRLLRHTVNPKRYRQLQSIQSTAGGKLAEKISLY